MPKMNAPFDLPEALQEEFDSTAEVLGESKASVLRMALAKGLPIVRDFLLSERQKLPAGLPMPVGDVSLNAAAPGESAGVSLLDSPVPSSDKPDRTTFRPSDETVLP